MFENCPSIVNDPILFPVPGVPDRCLLSMNPFGSFSSSDQTQFPVIMQLLYFILPLRIVVALGALEFEDLDLGDASHDSTLFSDENISDTLTESSSNFFLDDNDQWSSMTDLVPDLSFDSNGAWPEDVLLTENHDPSQTAETNSDFLLSDSDGCVVGAADDGQLFGKVRRQESCRAPPVGQAETPNQPEDPNSPDDDAPIFNPYGAVLARGLQRDPEKCPIMTFGQSNIPVCKSLWELQDFQVIGPNLYNIEYVLPRTSSHSLFVFSYNGLGSIC